MRVCVRGGAACALTVEVHDDVDNRVDPRAVRIRGRAVLLGGGPRADHPTPYEQDRRVVPQVQEGELLALLPQQLNTRAREREAAVSIAVGERGRERDGGREARRPEAQKNARAKREQLTMMSVSVKSRYLHSMCR